MSHLPLRSIAVRPRALAHLAALAALIGCTGPADTGETDTGQETGDTETDSDTDTDTEAGPCRVTRALFVQGDGTTQDVTSFLQSGEYLTLSLPGRLEVCPGTWFARLVLRADIDVVGLGDAPADTVLSGGEQGTILDIAGPDVTVTVNNVTLDRGAGLDVDHNSGGGGIYCDQEGIVEVSDVRFTNGFANDGAGLYARRCHVELLRSEFRDNLSEDDGGAVTLWESTATLTEVTIQDNTSLDGGAMAIFDSVVTIRDSVLSDNTATQFSAGIWLYDSELDMADSELSGNINTGTDYGGALLVQGRADLSNVTFSGNTARRGGGIYVNYDAVVNGDSCAFSGNSTDDVYAASPSGGRAHRGSNDTTIRCAENVCSVR